MKQTDDVSDPKSRLIEAARTLFAARGFEGASIRDITTAAGANLAAVTYHFGSKQELYYEVLRRLTEPLRDRVVTVAETPAPPLDRIGAALRNYFEHVRQNPELPSLMVRELATGGELPPPILKIVGQMIPVMAGFIAEGQRSGEIRSGDPVLMALSAIAIPVYLNVARPVIARAAGVDVRDPATFERIVEHTVATVRAQLANHS